MWKLYNKHWKKANKKHIQTYVTYLHNENLKATTIRAHLSAIAFYFQTKMDFDPTDSFSTKKLLKYYSKLDKSKSTRLPITQNILNKLMLHVDTCYADIYYKHAFIALYSTMFHLALRISEVSAYSSSFSHALELRDVKNYNNMLFITLRSHKHSTKQARYRVSQKVSLYSHIRNWIKTRGNEQGYLFSHPNNIPFSRDFILKNLNQDLEEIGLNSSLFNTHSFRKGRATSMATQGYSTEQIKLIGRWKTDAYSTYIQPKVIPL